MEWGPGSVAKLQREAERDISVAIIGHNSSVHDGNARRSQSSVVSPTLLLFHINNLLSTTSNNIDSNDNDCTTLRASIVNEENLNNSTISQSVHAQLFVPGHKDIVDWGHNKWRDIWRGDNWILLLEWVVFELFFTHQEVRYYWKSLGTDEWAFHRHTVFH